MRNVTLALAAAAVLVSGSLVAADPLAPGKPAGLHKAQDDSGNTVLYIVGLGAIGAGIAILATNNSSNNGPTSTAGAGSGGSTTTT